MYQSSAIGTVGGASTSVSLVPVPTRTDHVVPEWCLACQITDHKRQIQAPPQMGDSESERHACGAPIHPSLHTRAHRGPHHLSSTRRPGTSPNTLPAMATDFDFESSDILGGALPVGRGRVAQNSGFSSFFKICALGASTLVLLLAFRHGRTFFLRWKERHYKLYALFHSYPIPSLTQIVICKGLCADDTESRTMISDPSMSLMLPLDSPRRIRGKYRIDCEMCRQSTN